MTVAALYIDPRGPYPRMTDWSAPASISPRVDCWDETRDARKYDGPHPVVAHPPCGPWGRLSFLCTKQDPSCGPRAVEQVRQWGGVLEHPAGSQLWKHCGLPAAGAQPDAWGGYTVQVRQSEWGHCCAKPTLLYLVGVPREALEAPPFPGRDETHRVTNGSRGKTHLPRANAVAIRRTPPLFAEYLVRLARQARVSK